MSVSIRQTERLLLENHKFTQLGLSMMITRLQRLYAGDPSQEVLQKSMDEINTFIDKFKSIVVKDYEIISQL
ncbi:MAG: hypothetical protein FWD90_08085 [Defluviitaleaceae bacterium]|nr:hypothetical protein [Defluviitaleaceae bacterium]